MVIVILQDKMLTYQKASDLVCFSPISPSVMRITSLLSGLQTTRAPTVERSA
jgi:hypothetical protein